MGQLLIMNYFPLCMALVGMMECRKLIIKTNKNNYLTDLKDLMPRNAPFEDTDYGLTFAKKVKKANMMMEKGADVNFQSYVDNINVEYVNSEVTTSTPEKVKNPTATTEGTLTHCNIESLSFAVDISGSMAGSKHIW